MDEQLLDQNGKRGKRMRGPCLGKVGLGDKQIEALTLIDECAPVTMREMSPTGTFRLSACVCERERKRERKRERESADCYKPIGCHVDDRTLLDFPSSLVSARGKT
jgi:hypothetical protein